MKAPELARVIAAEMGGSVPAEVDGELRREKARSLGQFVIDAATVGGFIVQVVQLAIQINETQKTATQLILELEAKAASAIKIAKETRSKVIKRVVELLIRSK